MLTGIYTPSIETIAISAVGTFIIASDRPTCIALVDVTGEGATKTITITRGTWDGSTFTPIQLIVHISANIGDTNQIAALAMINVDEAAQVVVT